MKELITRDSVMKEVEECFKQLNRQIEERCVMHDSVLARSKCIDARNMLNRQIMEIKTVATIEENFFNASAGSRSEEKRQEVEET